MCFSTEQGDSAQALEAGDRLTLYATGYGGCHMRDLEVSCEATVDGDLIDITTETSWVRTEWFAVGCEEILLLTEATCETPPLDAGTYTVRYVDSESTLNVPGEIGGCLEGLPR